MSLGTKDKENLREFLKHSILPFARTKQGFDSAFIENLHITLYVTGFSKQGADCLVDVPTEEFGRLIRIPKSVYSQRKYEYNFVFAEDLLANNLDLIFPEEKELTAYQFRLTRNGEIAILMNESSDFL